MVRLLACAVLLAANGVTYAIDSVSLQPTRREAAATLIQKELERLADSQDSKAEVASLKAVATEVARLVPENVLVRQLLDDVDSAEDEPTSPKQAAHKLRGTLREVANILRFERKVEAQSPEGFPEATPIGEIAIKSYPDHRLARTHISPAASEDAGFFRLFAHIKSNAIEMTAPVQMTYGPANDKKLEPQSMAFFYEVQTIGKTGEHGHVKVVDVPASTVVSIGMRGDYSDDALKQAQKLLDKWLKQHAEQYKADGPLRVMGHNSPMVPVKDRYFEVQIPVSATNKDRSLEAGKS
jgi:hypothetical protein